MKGKIEEINIENIIPNPFEPRKNYDKEKLEELASSIKEIGQIEEIKVKTANDGKYQLIRGGRRVRACKLINKKTIRAIVVKDIGLKEQSVESIISNDYREALSDNENVNAYKKLMKNEKIPNINKLSKIMGKSPTTLRNMFSAVEIRNELREEIGEQANNIPKTMLLATKNLSLSERIKAIKLSKKYEIIGEKFDNLIIVLNKAPEKVKNAILDQQISYSDVYPLLDVEISEKMVRSLVEELEKRKKIRELDKEIAIDLDKRILTGDIKATSLKFIRSRDEQLRDKIRSIRDKLWVLPPTTLKIMENNRMFSESADLVEDIKNMAIGMLNKAR